MMISWYPGSEFWSAFLSASSLFTFQKFKIRIKGTIQYCQYSDNTVLSIFDDCRKETSHLKVFLLSNTPSLSPFPANNACGNQDNCQNNSTDQYCWPYCFLIAIVMVLMTTLMMKSMTGNLFCPVMQKFFQRILSPVLQILEVIFDVII